MKGQQAFGEVTHALMRKNYPYRPEPGHDERDGGQRLAKALLNRNSKSGLANAEKSTDTCEIMNRCRTLGIARSILRCAVAVAMLIMYGSEHLPIRIWSLGVDIVLGDGIPLR